ncbi:site-specific integrase [Leucobacter sp. gxy201]|uniref:tyrosine-type recombinase/integrase n=1 Tax=Leucobacter sp. gxy201 TaxID=2957200 RepID=UPI003DA06787
MSTRKTASKRRPKTHRDALGSTEQLPSGRWRARYKRDGATFPAPRTFATKQDALDWLASERADRARGIWHDPNLGKVKLTDFATDWLASRSDLAARTVAAYQAMLDGYILPRIGGPRGVELGRLTLAEITPAVVRAWWSVVLIEARERIKARHERAQLRQHPARTWALENGYAVKLTGRIPPAALAAWKAAGSPLPAPAREAIEDVSTDPGRVTAVNAYRVLRNVMNAAVHDELITSNPCKIPGAGTNHHPERPTATPAEVATIAEHMPPRLAAAVTLAAWSGLRFGEVFALARRHIDLDAGTVRVERALIVVHGEPVRFGKPKTHSSRRTVYLPQFVLEEVRAHLSAYVPAAQSALVFSLENGEPLTSARLSRYYRAARAAAGRPDLRFHDLRHTGATLAYSAGASMREVQNRLGHSTNRAAAIYAHAADGSDAVLAHRLDALYAPPAEPPTPPDTPTPAPPVSLADRRRAA